MLTQKVTLHLPPLVACQHKLQVLSVFTHKPKVQLHLQLQYLFCWLTFTHQLLSSLTLHFTERHFGLSSSAAFICFTSTTESTRFVWIFKSFQHFNKHFVYSHFIRVHLLFFSWNLYEIWWLHFEEKFSSLQWISLKVTFEILYMLII